MIQISPHVTQFSHQVRQNTQNLRQQAAPTKMFSREGAAVFLLLLANAVTCQAASCDLNQRPNIVYVNLDDVGYGDVSWHDGTMDTPTIQQIGHEGRFMEYVYTLQSCTPSRSALLSGRYPFRYGLSKNAIEVGELNWLPEDLVLLPQELKKLDYKTHMIGKWHVGACHWNLLPLNRGFDTFYGKAEGNSDYYTHGAQNNLPGYYNFFDQTKNVTDAPGHYSTTLYFERAQKIILEHSGPRPFFMYVAPQTAHTPYQVPDHYHAKNTVCGRIAPHNRRIFCAMLAAADEGIRNIIQALKDKGLYDKTVFVVTSDNGGNPVTEPGPRSSSNWPLRGGKVSLWEGGTRVFAVFRAPGLVNKGSTWNHLFHVTDWKPTLIQAACGDQRTSCQDDGFPMYDALVNDTAGRRRNLIYNIWNPGKYAAVRGPRFKLMRDNIKHSTGWYPPETIQPDVIEVPFKALPTGYHLYDLINDPTEQTNVYDRHKNDREVLSLKAQLESEDLNAQPLQNHGSTPVASALSRQVNYMLPGWCDAGLLPSACSPSPCQNGGTCILQDGGYYCLCLRRASGLNCETLAPCQESKMVPGSRLVNAPADVTSNKFVITAVDPKSVFKSDYVIDSGKKAIFESVTFRMLGGNAKSIQFEVYDGSSKVQNGSIWLSKSLKDQQWTSPFVLAPVGDSVLFSVNPDPANTAGNVAMEIVDVGYCLEETTTTTTTTPAPINYPSGCVSGWSEFQGSCYKFYSGSVTFDEASVACSGLRLSPSGAVMSPAKTAAEFKFIYFTLAPANSPLWVGATDVAVEGTFVWLDGSPLTYSNWQAGEPDCVLNTWADMDCVDVRASDGKWRNAPCTWTRPYVCRYTPGV